MIRKLVLTLVALAITGEAASAAVTYNFEAGQDSYTVAPSAPLLVPIYLKEALSGGSSSQIVADDGLFGFGITVDQTSGGGQMTNLVRNPTFDNSNPGSTTTFPADPIKLWADQLANLNNGPDPDANGRILLATLTFQAPASGSTTFAITDFGASDQTVTYAANALDALITPRTFSVTVAVPEPTTAALLLVPLAGLLRRRRA